MYLCKLHCAMTHLPYKTLTAAMKELESSLICPQNFDDKHDTNDYEAYLSPSADSHDTYDYEVVGR